MIQNIGDLKRVDESDNEYPATDDGVRMDVVDAAVAVNNGETLSVVTDPYPDNPHSETYYHVAPQQEDMSIAEAGLYPTEAEECAEGYGVHLTETKNGAFRWAETLRNERGYAHEVQTVWEVRVPKEVPVVDDKFTGPGPSDSVVACTTFGIPPRFLKPMEAV